MSLLPPVISGVSIAITGILHREAQKISTINYLLREVVEEALKLKYKSISPTINEPTIFYEYMYDIVKIAKEKELLTLFHTNGTLSPQALGALLKYMDGVTVVLKAFDEKFYQETSFAELKPVLKTLKIIKEEGVHLEVVNLIIPTLNDDPEDIKRMCIWIRETLGEDVPLHFYPLLSGL